MSLQSTDQIADLNHPHPQRHHGWQNRDSRPNEQAQSCCHRRYLVNAGYIDSYEVEDGKTSRCASCHHQQRWREHQNHRDYQSFETYSPRFTLAPPKPSRQIYCGAVLISTSKGIMTGREAKSNTSAAKF